MHACIHTYICIQLYVAATKEGDSEEVGALSA